ncbi:MAG TPA: FAD-dependent monooxygenase [Actinophytocola sp.]|jgi:salicylate hydroxylase|uniref:FAD-dependent monooxygenase n=1 Tax=Actinophytocola sp. TaxID=1872138 RepID=UPI002F948D17
MTSERPRIVVVGAGIAGLAAAAALARAGLACQVFEQAPELSEVGAGIQLSPNGSRLLHRLGLGAALDRVAVRPQAIEVRRWDDDQVLTKTTLGAACAELYGAPYYTLHRADLHQVLVDALAPGTVVLDRRCVGVTELADTVRLTFADGATVDADLVIGADGIRSAIRGHLLADQPRFSGQAVFRGVVDAAELPALVAEGKVLIWMGPGQHCVCYPISAGRLVSFAASTAAGDWRAESWSAGAATADLLTAYDGWNPVVRSVLGAPESVIRWALYDRPAVPRWSSARLMLIGDAAHPMLPFGAQGASQGIEDALALAACLAGASAATVPAALRRYEAVRRPRTEQVHRFIQDNERDHHVEDGAEQRERDERMRADFGLRQRAWLFGYDAEAAATSPEAA